MHRAPAVNVQIGRSHVHGLVLGFWWSLGCLAFLAFWFDQNIPIWTIFFAGVLGAAGFTAWRAWCSAPIGTLRWDGQAWYWSAFGAASPCHLALTLDFQVWMLVVLRTQDRPTVWLWLDASCLGMKWTPLRRAVVVCGQINGSPTSARGAEDAP
jgi:hypothetical protein